MQVCKRSSPRLLAVEVMDRNFPSVLPGDHERGVHDGICPDPSSCDEPITKSASIYGYMKWKKPFAKYTMPTAPTNDAIIHMDFLLIKAAMEHRRIPICRKIIASP